MQPILAAIPLLLLSVLTGCASDTPKGETLTVYAAASLKQPFTAIGEQFKTDHPG